MSGTQPYISVAEFRVATLMPQPFVAEIVAESPGFLESRIFYASARIDRSLVKRYAAPFQAPYPAVILEWVVTIVTYECWLKRGIAATDQQMEQVEREYLRALAELKEAADSETGLFELPLRSDKDDLGVTKGGPFGYSEQSPYRWTTLQAKAGRQEDSQT